MTHPLTYRGWEVDKYRQPDCCFYAFAPDYDGLTPGDTQCAPALPELCELIDQVIAERAQGMPSEGPRRECGSGASAPASPVAESDAPKDAPTVEVRP